VVTADCPVANSRFSAINVPQPPSLRLSACVITFNEAGCLADCLDSLAFCDEIIVVDSRSTDATVAIAEARGARVFLRPFEGFRSQKQFAVEQATHDWLLCLPSSTPFTPFGPDLPSLRRARSMG
jgi:hypothetical protein